MSNGTEKLAKDWKELATRIFAKQPDWNAAQIRRQLIVVLGESKTPGISAVQKLLPVLKTNYQAMNETGLDNPWHLGLMGKYNIPPEAIPNIMAVQEWCSKEHSDVLLFESKPLTIRQALWIARLHGIAQLLRAGKAKGKNPNLDLNMWLWLWSKAYSQYEILCKLSNTSTNTTQLDNALWHGAIPISATNAVDLLYPDTLETVIEINKEDGEA